MKLKGRWVKHEAMLSVIDFLCSSSLFVPHISGNDCTCFKKTTLWDNLSKTLYLKQVFEFAKTK